MIIFKSGVGPCRKQIDKRFGLQALNENSPTFSDALTIEADIRNDKIEGILSILLIFVNVYRKHEIEVNEMLSLLFQIIDRTGLSDNSS